EGAAEAGDAGKIAQRLLHRLADDDGGVLGGVVEIDMQVALGPDLEVDHGMAGETLQHVVEKTDAGVDVGLAAAVQVERHRDFGLAGLSLYGSSTHGGSGGVRGFL